MSCWWSESKCGKRSRRNEKPGVRLRFSCRPISLTRDLPSARRSSKPNPTELQMVYSHAPQSVNCTTTRPTTQSVATLLKSHTESMFLEVPVQHRWEFDFGETHVKNTETDPITAPMVPRRARLKPQDFQEFGYTVGCPGCDQLQIGGSLRQKPHRCLTRPH